MTVSDAVIRVLSGQDTGWRLSRTRIPGLGGEWDGRAGSEPFELRRAGDRAQALGLSQDASADAGVQWEQTDVLARLVNQNMNKVIAGVRSPALNQDDFSGTYGAVCLWITGRDTGNARLIWFGESEGICASTKSAVPALSIAAQLTQANAVAVVPARSGLSVMQGLASLAR